MAPKKTGRASEGFPGRPGTPIAMLAETGVSFRGHTPRPVFAHGLQRLDRLDPTLVPWTRAEEREPQAEEREPQAEEREPRAQEKQSSIFSQNFGTIRLLFM